MVSKKIRNRYVPPELQQAKALADQRGMEYYEARLRGPRLAADRFLIESTSKFTGYDCAEELKDLDVEIVRAYNHVPLARERLREARAQLALLRSRT